MKEVSSNMNIAVIMVQLSCHEVEYSLSSWSTLRFWPVVAIKSVLAEDILRGLLSAIATSIKANQITFLVLYLLKHSYIYDLYY